MLLDENIAARLVAGLADIYPGSAHLSEVGLLGANDLAIWEYARDRRLVLVTKDEDFQRLSILFGPPPKVVWIRLGNCSTNDISRLLRARQADIDAFTLHDEAGFLALS